MDKETALFSVAVGVIAGLCVTGLRRVALQRAKSLLDDEQAKAQARQTQNTTSA